MRSGFFAEKIESRDDWFPVFQSVSAFEPLVGHIFERENLPFAGVEKLHPGTNAVFKVGEYVVKIFAPPGLCQDFGTTIEVELFGMRLANARGVPSPRLVATGVVEDRYTFRYIVMEYIRGKMLSEVEGSLSFEDKVQIGKNVRKITDRLNVPCENFSPFDVVEYAVENKEWEVEGFPASFLEERLAFLKGFRVAEGEKVYCHGDFHEENILVDDKLNVFLVDFADAMYAPVEYEWVYIVSALFCFERPYMLGFFGKYRAEDIVDLCMKWLPVHAWGHSNTAENLKPAEEIVSFDVMRTRLRELVEREREKG